MQISVHGIKKCELIAVDLLTFRVGAIFSGGDDTRIFASWIKTK